ncbi:ROK family protein [Microbacterium sp. ASV49]|uniref:ROK family protein n=1 Tax=Microbacterium candidum TaxID=3041922 RepID=A0ABT7MX06_9MICO|nr:ROK family protein [Microbacterium sp. ASV49]MDL9978982.1 ROK family protein [Microbacterium sp. ASV49]
MRVGLDVGGTKTDAVAIDAAGNVQARVRRTTGWGPEAVAATVVDAVGALADELALPVAAFESVGVGIPGLVEPGTTRVAHAVNLGIVELDLAAAVAPTLGLPVAVENDVKAAALGAYALGDGTGTLAYLNFGTGVAAGIVVDGVLWTGSTGTAGEVGHLSIDPDGPLCTCGQHGCVEAFSGGGTVARRWGRPGELPVRDIFDAADAGDAEAIVLRDGVAYGISAAIRALVLTVDAGTVVLGGGITMLGDRLMAVVGAQLEQSAEASPFIRSLRLDERVRVLPAGSPVAAIGAALLGAHRDTQEVLAHG